MIRKAQHMTSAFKMDEKENPFRDSSVPSDRFYDDFDLKFDFLKQDSVENNFFYYDLAIESPQKIQCEIYSARIKAIDNGEDAYVQIGRYLKKAIAEHKSGNKLDQFFSYTGDGSYSNSMVAWTPEAFTIREQMPKVFDREGRARFIRYNFSPYPKDDIINMLKREDLDLSIFHEHGLPHRMYLSGSPETQSWTDHMDEMKYYWRGMARRYENRPKDFKAMLDRMQNKYGLDSTWIDGWNDPKVIEEDSLRDLRTGIILPEVTEIKPNSRMVIFDACYNGDFREKDYIAGRFIMSEGKCVTTFANSVNVLQDALCGAVTDQNVVEMFADMLCKERCADALTAFAVYQYKAWPLRFLFAFCPISAASCNSPLDGACPIVLAIPFFGTVECGFSEHSVNQFGIVAGSEGNERT
jgi:hypothetical protein